MNRIRHIPIMALLLLSVFGASANAQALKPEDVQERYDDVFADAIEELVELRKDIRAGRIDAEDLEDAVNDTIGLQDRIKGLIAEEMEQKTLVSRRAADLARLKANRLTANIGVQAEFGVCWATLHRAGIAGDDKRGDRLVKTRRNVSLRYLVCEMAKRGYNMDVSVAFFADDVSISGWINDNIASLNPHADPQPHSEFFVKLEEDGRLLVPREIRIDRQDVEPSRKVWLDLLYALYTRSDTYRVLFAGIRPIEPTKGG